jgi:hypothetical protein
VGDDGGDYDRVVALELDGERHGGGLLTQNGLWPAGTGTDAISLGQFWLWYP